MWHLSYYRIILSKRKFDHITTDVRDRLHWLPVQQRIEYKVCVLVYKSLHQAAPAYLAELCSSEDSVILQSIWNTSIAPT